MRSTAKIEAEWRAKLAASGFADLESPDRDAPLSNGGRFHDRGNKGDKDGEYMAVSGQLDAVAERVEHGAAYTSWALDVLRQLNGHHAAGRKRRRIWERYADGESMKEISRTPGFTFHGVRKTVKAIEEKYGKCQQKESDPRHLAKTTGPSMRVQIAALLASALARPETSSG